MPAKSVNLKFELGELRLLSVNLRHNFNSYRFVKGYNCI